MCGAELKELPIPVQRVAAELHAKGHLHLPRMLDDAARTAQQAADGLGVLVGQIAKSIIFRRKSDDIAVLVVTSGDRRVDEKKVEALVGKLGRADAEFVKAKTGFSIGGVAPLAGDGTGLICELRKMYFLPDLRGLGAGKALIHRCIETARTFGFKHCYLETLEHMAAARKLYQANGFVEIAKPCGNTGHFSCDRFYQLEL